MDDTPRFHTDRPLAFGTVQAVGLGAVAGALEAAVLASTLKLPLSAGGFFVLGVVDVLVMAGFALAVAGLVGAGWFARPSAQAADADPVIGWAWQAAITTLALTGWYLGFEAAERIGRGDPIPGALALAAMPIGFAGLAYYNARFWFRWVERSHQPWGWPILAWVGSAGLVIASTIGFASRDTGGRAGFEDDLSAVIITVDGLGPDALEQAPILDGLALRESGIAFVDGVTPTPETRSANATVLTGLHPLRHQVFTDAQVLSPRYPTLFSVVRQEGWRTAGFVSSEAAGADSHIGDDLHLLDDALTPSAWLGSIDVLGRLQAALGSGAVHRDAAATVARFTEWLSRQGDSPFVAWIHLDDPLHSARIGDDPAEAIGNLDAAIGAVVGALEDREVRHRTLLVVAGTHGVTTTTPPNRTLTEPVVRVPIVIDAPGQTFAVHRVEAQVRLLDVVNTVSEWLELPPIDTSEGISLLDYATGNRKRPMSCALVGRAEDGRWLLGLRNNGVKYWADAEGDKRLYLLPDDPTETTDLAAAQPEVVQQAERILVIERTAMTRLLWR
ncbi:MAG: sulfatase-like hydrolase/transferase [Myxococcota bacterium]